MLSKRLKRQRSFDTSAEEATDQAQAKPSSPCEEKRLDKDEETDFTEGRIHRSFVETRVGGFG